MCACISVCMYLCLYVHVLVCVCLHGLVYTCVCVFMCMCTPVYMHMPVCTYKTSQEWEERGIQLDVFVSLDDPVTQESPLAHISGARKWAGTNQGRRKAGDSRWSSVSG